jgi:uncharacterized protein (AIM24 family)
MEGRRGNRAAQGDAMNIRIEQARLQLARHRYMEVVDGEGASMHCLAGTLWVTQDGDPRDVVLAPGESFTLDRNGVAIVYATDDAALCFSRSASALTGH